MIKTRDILKVALLLALTACQEVDRLVNGPAPVRLCQQAEPPVTRAAQNLNEFYVAEGDVVRVMITETTEDGGVATDVTTDYSYTAGANGTLNSTEGTPMAYYPAEGDIDIVSWSPYDVQENFSVQTDQTSDANYKLSDLMYASAENCTYDDGIVPLRYAHKMSKLNVNVIKEDGISEITAIKLKNVQCSAHVDLMTGEVTTAATDEDHPLKDITVANNGAVVFPPQKLSGVFLVVTTPTGDATFVIEEQEFVVNGEYTLTVYLNSVAIGETTTIGNWDENGNSEVKPEDDKNRIVIGAFEGEPYTWTGDPIEPKPAITFNGTTLGENDYDIIYYDNINKGIATIVVKGKGTYADYVSAKTFHISGKEDGAISFENATASTTFSINADENHYRQEITNTGDGAVAYALSNNTCGATVERDGTVNFTRVGSVKVKATVDDGPNCVYAEVNRTAEYTLTVTKGSVGISFENSTVNRVFSTTLSENTYTQEVNNPGDGTVGYTISNNTCGASISGATVKYTKAGSVTVKATVADGLNFTYSTKTATYTLTVAPYTGGLQVSVSAGSSARKTTRSAAVSYTYDGTVKAPIVSVTCNGTVLEKDVDYTLSGTTSATDAGTYTVTANGIGGYSGKGSAEWGINVNSGKLQVLQAQAVTYTYSGTAQTPAFIVKYGDKTLREGVDYTLGGTKSATAAGNYTVTANGIGGYSGSGSLDWTVARKPITITAKAQTVNYGTAISKTTGDVTVATLSSGHTLTDITLAQSTTNVTTSGVITPSGATIKSGSTNVTTNYDITYNTGRLTVKAYSGALTVSLSSTAYTYDGTVKSPAITVTCGGKTLTAGVDYTLSGVASATAAGTYTVTATGKGGYSGTGSTTWKINPQSTALTVSVGTESYAYDGSAKSPTVTVKCGDKTLTAGTDYTVSGTTSATNVGTYTINVTGKGNYSGTGTKTWKVVAQSGGLTVTTSPTSYTYDGAAKTPTVTVKYGSKTLTKGTDYTLSGNTSATAVGSNYKITATGKGNYSGTGSATWSIVANSTALTVSVSPTSYTYNGSAKTPTVTVKCGSKTLTSGTDYTVTEGASGTGVGTYTVKVQGKGNYSGSGTATWSIGQANGYVSLSPTSGTVDAGSSATFTIGSNHGGTLSVAATGGSTNRSGSISRSGNTVTIPTNTSSTSAASVTITVTCAATTNYKAATATYTLSIREEPMTLAKVKTFVNGGGSTEKYRCWYVNSSGQVHQNYVSGDIGLIGCVSTSDVETSMSGSRILVMALEDVGSYKWKTNTTNQESAYANESAMNGLQFTTTFNNGTYPAAQACYGWSKSRPSGASHWFLPSRGQWNAIFRSAAAYLNTSGPGVIGDNTQRWVAVHSYGKEAETIKILSNGVAWGSETKTSSFKVRAIFAY